MTNPPTPPGSASSQSDTPPAPVRARGLGVRRPGQTPPTPSATTPTTEPPPAPAAASAGYETAPDPIDTAAVGSTPSASDSAELKLDAGVVNDLAEGALNAVTGRLHAILARTPEEIEAGLWIADRDDIKAIGKPLGRIAARNAGHVAVPNPDIGDAIAAGLGVLIYVMKNVQTQMSIRRAARRLRNSLPDLVEHPEQAAAAPA